MAKGRKTKSSNKRGAASASSAADLLRGGFVGFDAFAAPPPSNLATKEAPQAQTLARASPSVSPSAFYTGSNSEIAAVFKIIAKKDKTTKVRGLQSLASLLSTQTSAAEVRQCLPHWLYLHADLQGNNDRLVREHTANVLAVFVAKIPKAMRKNKIYILPMWIPAMFDLDADVARRNRESLEALYGDKRAVCAAVVEAWMEVLAGLRRHLKAVSDQSSEAIDRDERLKICTLRTVAYLAEIGIEETCLKQCLESTIWQLCKNRSGVVRLECYRLLGVLCNQRREVVDVKTLAQSVCNALGKERDIAAVPALWDALIALLRDPNAHADEVATGSFATCEAVTFWEVVAYRKSFFPQLWTFLSSGVGGAGDKVYPNLLPFVALIPEAVLTAYASDAAPLIETFFSKLWEGQASNDVGLHNVPFLIRAVLECAAYLYGRIAELPPSTGDSVGVLHSTCARVVRFYLEEPLQFKRGSHADFHDALKLVLRQVEKHLRDKENGMPALMESVYSICEDCFSHSVTTANRVVELLSSEERFAHVRLKLLKHQLQQQSIALQAPTAVLAVKVDMDSLSADEKGRLVMSLQLVMHEANEQVMNAALHVVGTDIDAWASVLHGFFEDASMQKPRGVSMLAAFISMSNAKLELWQGLQSSTQLKALADVMLTPSETLCNELESNESKLDQWARLLQILLIPERCVDVAQAFRAKLESMVTSVLQDDDDRFPPRAIVDIYIGSALVSRGEAHDLIAILWTAIACLQQTHADAPILGRLETVRQGLELNASAVKYVEGRMRELLHPESTFKVERASGMCAELVLSETTLLAVLCEESWWVNGSAVAVNALEEMIHRVPPAEIGQRLQLPDSLPWKGLCLNPESTGIRSLLVSERRYLLYALLCSNEDVKAFKALADMCRDSTTLDDFIREDLEQFVVEKERFDLWEYFAPAMKRTGMEPELRRELRTCANKLNSLIPVDLIDRCRKLLDSHKPTLAEEPKAKLDGDEPPEHPEGARPALTFSIGESVSHRIETGVFVQARVAEASTSTNESDEVAIEFKRGSGELAREWVKSSALERSFNRGEAIVYDRSGKEGRVVMVHSDDPKYPPYYTIQVGSQEIQTVSKWLRLSRAEEATKSVASEGVSSNNSNGPSSLAQLQKMLADARRAGDHKESLRLMKLLPEFTPKPVDTEAVKAEKFTKEKKKREEARQQMKQIKAQIRQSKLDNITGVSKPSSTPVVPSKIDGESAGVVTRGVQLKEVANLAMGMGNLTGKWRGVAGVGLNAEEIDILRETCVVLSHLVPLTVVARAAQGETQAALLVAAVNIAMNLGHLSNFRSLPPSAQSYYARLVLVGISRGSGKGGMEHETMLSSLRLVEAVLSVDVVDQEPLLHEALPDAFDIFASTTNPEVRLTSASLLRFLPPGFFVEDESRLGKMFAVLEKSDSCRRVATKVCGTYLATLADPAMMEHLYKCYQGLPPSLETFFEDEAKTITFQQMLMWVLVLRTLRKLYLLFTETREHCTSWLQDRQTLARILSTAFAILGAMRGVDIAQFGPETTRPAHGIETHNGLAVTDDELLSAYETRNARSLALGVILRTLRVLPALSRQFCNDSLGRTDRASVLKLVRERISPRIVEEEVEEIRRAVDEGAFDSAMEIHASARNGSIMTTYEKDGCTLEMGIRLSDCHPVVLPTCECTKQVGVTQSRWRRWVIQIVSLLSHQDGSVLDAVFLFKQNLDKEFEGAEPCPICYCVIHVQDHSMPRLACKTCSNKFHSKCIAKWFATSHKNECPLCKQPF